MKTSIAIFIFTFCTFFHVAMSQETIKRPVFWIKGFTSEEQGVPGWTRYDTLFSRQFYMKGFKPTYLSNKPIAAIASIFRTQTIDHFNLTRTLPYDTSFSDISTSILIGHSMGGLVARAWEQQNRLQNRSPEFAGIITVATPNQGSSANRMAKDGILFDAVDRTNNLLSDPLTTTINDKTLVHSPYLTTLFTASTTLGIIEKLKTGINTTMAAAIQRKDPFISAFDDMIPHSTFLDSLNASNQVGTVVPIINIQCVANFPSFYRVVHSQLPFIKGPHDVPIDEYKDDAVIKAVDVLASSLLIAGIGGAPVTTLEILGQPNDTMTAKLVRDPMMIYAMAASQVEFPALRTWRTLKYDIPAAIAVLFGSAEILYLPYSATMQKITRTTENGVTDGRPLYRLVRTDEGEFVPIINEGDDGTLSESAQVQPFHKLRIERVTDVTHVSVQNNQNIRLKLRDIFREPNSPFSIPGKQ